MSDDYGRHTWSVEQWISKRQLEVRVEIAARYWESPKPRKHRAEP